MKKKILGGAFIIALVVVSTLNINFDRVGNNSDLILVNVEALATESGPFSVFCYNTISTAGTDPIKTQIYCGDCLPVQCRRWSSLSSCSILDAL